MDTQENTQKEAVKELAWNLCKEYEWSGKPKDLLLLKNYVSAGIESKLSVEVENLYRQEWKKEVNLFIKLYGGEYGI